MYKTKACGVLRNSSLSKGKQSRGTSRVMIEQESGQTTARSFISKRKSSTTSTAITGRKQTNDSLQMQPIFNNETPSAHWIGDQKDETFRTSEFRRISNNFGGFEKEGDPTISTFGRKQST